MLLGKRPRPPMMRTTSMTEITVDLSIIDAPAPSDPRNPIQNQQKPASIEGPARQSAGFVGSDGFDNRVLATVSPRNSKRNSADFVETAHFLRACSLCKRSLAPGRDIYMYRGDSAFCSLECRQQQMNQDERREKCYFASKKEGAPPSATGSEPSSKGERVVAT